MLSCEMCLERMSLALDVPLSLEDRRELEEHLAVCPECRAAYEALFQMEDALREIGETPAPAELSARVMEQIRAEEDRQKEQSGGEPEEKRKDVKLFPHEASYRLGFGRQKSPPSRRWDEGPTSVVPPAIPAPTARALWPQ